MMAKKWKTTETALLVITMLLVVAWSWGKAGATTELKDQSTSSVEVKVSIEATTGVACIKAKPLEKPGLPNLYQISGDLYRGAQPTAEGMLELKKMGVRTVINLRSFHSDGDLIGETGLAYEHLYVKAWHPEDEEVVRFLQIVSDQHRTPAFVHCKRGADRTGVMCAIYRVAVCGWNKQEALKEMTEGGFGFQPVWKNLVEYVSELDIEGIKRRAGL